MSDPRWTEVDALIADKLTTSDAVLDAALAANELARLPAIDVSAAQGKMLHLLVRGTKARRVLEIGTLGGYSTIWLARALPEDGQLVTLDWTRTMPTSRGGILRTPGWAGGSR